MRVLYYVENVSEIDKRSIYVCRYCMGPVSYQKTHGKRYEWLCNTCGTELLIESLKIKIGEKSVK